MVRAFFLALLILIPQWSWSDDPAICESCILTPGIGVLPLAGDWDSILGKTNYLSPGDNHFNLNPSETETFSLWSNYQQTLSQADCTKKWKPRLKIDFQGGTKFAGKSEMLVRGATPNATLDIAFERYIVNSNYDLADSLMAAQWNEIKTKCNQDADPQKCIGEYQLKARLKAAEQLKTSLKSFTDEEWVKRVEKYRNSPLTPDERKALPTVLALYRSLLCNSASESFALFSQYKDKINTADKLYIARRLGGLFAEGYDHKRSNNEGPSVGKAVLPDEILKAASINTIVGAQPDGVDENGYTKYDRVMKAGVCRDIAGAQGQILRALGMNQTYVIEGYSPGGPHAYLYTQDPKDKSRSYILNYGDGQTTTQQSGASLLHPSELFGQEVSTRYAVCEPGGKVLYTTPSATALTAIEGFEGLKAAQELSPGYRPSTQYLGRATLDIGGGAQATLFSAQNIQGTQSVGIGTTIKYGDDQSIAPGKLTTGAQVRMSKNPIQDKTITAEEIFVNFEQKLQSPAYVFDQDSYSYVKAFTTLGVQGLFGTVQNKLPGQDPLYASPNGQLWLGTQAHTGKPEDRFQGNLTAKTEIQVGYNDERNELKTLNLYSNQSVIQADAMWNMSNTPEGRRELEKSPLGQRFLTLKAAAIMNTFGGTLIGESRFNWDRHQVTAEIQQPLKSDMPLFLEGSVPWASLTYQYSATKNWNIWGRLSSPTQKGYGPGRVDLGTSVKLGE